MDIKSKVEILEELGKYFRYAVEPDDSISFVNSKIRVKAQELNELIPRAQHENGWFTEDSVKIAMNAWAKNLNKDNIETWLSRYSFGGLPKSVGVIMAGNIPLVGLHDALCVLLSDHHLKVKLSSKDQLLMMHVLDTLKTIEPNYASRIHLNVQLKDLDYLIATGSDNSARYFDYYFKEVKKIIRKNRTSVAIVSDEDTAESLTGLAEDVFTHFGLGCRNVTKVFVPQSYDLDNLFAAFFKYQEIANHNKYANNYDYNKAVYLLNKIELIENGFLLLKEDDGLHSPVGVLFYEYYNSQEELSLKLNLLKEEIQCKVSSIREGDFIPFGNAQQPELWDYADGIDTIAFLN